MQDAAWLMLHGTRPSQCRPCSSSQSELVFEKQIAVPNVAQDVQPNHGDDGAVSRLGIALTHMPAGGQAVQAQAGFCTPRSDQ